jgi:hypothetical protein
LPIFLAATRFVLEQSKLFKMPAVDAVRSKEFTNLLRTEFEKIIQPAQ